MNKLKHLTLQEAKKIREKTKRDPRIENMYVYGNSLQGDYYKVCFIMLDKEVWFTDELDKEGKFNSMHEMIDDYLTLLSYSI